MSTWSRLASMIAPDDGFLYHDARYLAADLAIDPAAAKRWVPWPLRLASPAIEMRGTLGEMVARPPPFLGRPHRNVRSSIGLAIPWIVAFTPREVPVEVRRAELEVRISGSARDPLHELGFGRVLAAHLHRVNLGRGGLPWPVGVASPLDHARNLLLRVH